MTWTAFFFSNCNCEKKKQLILNCFSDFIIIILEFINLKKYSSFLLKM